MLLGVSASKGLLPGLGPMASLGFLRAATSIWFASAAMAFLITADLLGLELFGRAAGVTAAVLAGYQACGLLGRACYYIGDALADAVFPFMARTDDPEDRNRWFMAPVRWVMLLIVPIQVGFLLAPGPVLRLFLPAHYAGAQTLLRLIAAGTIGALMTDMLMKGLFAGGHGRHVGRRMFVAVTVEVVGLVILVPRYGPVGAGISYLLASYSGMALLGFLYLRVNRVRPPSLRQAGVYVAGITPTALAFFLAGRTASPVAWSLITVGAVLFIWPARRMGLIEDTDLNALRAGRARLSRTRAGMLIASLLGEWWLIAVCVGVAAAGLGYNLFSSPDVLYDEAAYTWAAQQVAQGWHLTLDNQPFFVHPPLMFLLQAGWLRLTGQATAALPSAIRSARLLAASAGAADVLLIAGMGYRLAGAAGPRQRRAITIVVACLAAVDPVLTRYDRQNVIEPYALAAGLLTLHAAWHLADRGALRYVSVTGLLGGLTLLTNEIAFALVVVPLLAAILQRDWPLIRRSAGRARDLVRVRAVVPGLGGRDRPVRLVRDRADQHAATADRPGADHGAQRSRGFPGRLAAPVGEPVLKQLHRAGDRAGRPRVVLPAVEQQERKLSYRVAHRELRPGCVHRGGRNAERAVFRLSAPGGDGRQRAVRRCADRRPGPGPGPTRRAAAARRRPAPARCGDRLLLGGARPFHRELGGQLHRTGKRRRPREPVHRREAAGLRRGQRQRRRAEVLLHARRAQPSVVLRRARGPRRRGALLPAGAERRYRAGRQHEPRAGHLDQG